MVLNIIDKTLGRYKPEKHILAAQLMNNNIYSD